jgi:glyoxylase-like metal-dependent hydrolase (beta-lactamase superfamily II)
MITKISTDFYKLEIPLPSSPLKYVNSYLIVGRERALLIDTGLNHDACYQAIQNCLDKLGVALSDVDIFLTHFHIDHAGLVWRLVTPATKIYCSRVDGAILKILMADQDGRLAEHSKLYLEIGFPAEAFKGLFSNKNGYRFKNVANIELTIVEDGELLEVGDYMFRCILTPGHTPGHMCLYEPKHKILVSGDHILFDISPNIVCYHELTNSLKAYMESLEKISRLDVDLVLPGHRNENGDLTGRIAELRGHHVKRIDEILATLHDEAKTAWDVAASLTWGVFATGIWDKWPVLQKWFALGETIAHLKYLEEEGRISREVQGDRILYMLG